MKEFFLSFFFAGDELHIIDDQDVNVAIFIAEASDFETNTVEKFFHESFRANIGNFHFGIALDDGVADSLNQVSFAQANTAVDEKRVILGARIGSCCLASSVGEVVARTNHKVIKSVARVKGGVGGGRLGVNWRAAN